jgi:hypothetical protein
MINPAAEKLMRRNASDLLGHTLLKNYPSVATDGLFEKFTRIIEENVALDFEYQTFHTGSSCWYRLAGVKLGDGLALSYTEITARKLFELQLQESKESQWKADQARVRRSGSNCALGAKSQPMCSLGIDPSLSTRGC